VKPNCLLQVLLFASWLIIPTQLVAAELQLASLFKDRSVLQRDAVVTVWGSSEANDEIGVEFADQKITTQADAKGKWMVKLQPMKANTKPQELVVRSKTANKTVKLVDVLVGDVWLCTGQSNMVVPLRNAVNGDVEVKQANHPLIRLYQVPQTARETPQTRCGGDWTVCTPATAQRFCAVGYFFGRKLHTSLGVPIGLIQSSWGSTAAESWTSEAVLKASPEFKSIIGTREKQQKQPEDDKAGGSGDKELPGGIYNGMIAPLTPYAFRGAIWYQGESNTGDEKRAEAYRRLLPAMVKGWREDFGQEFPFYIVQLANYAKRGDAPAANPWRVSVWSLLRESQAEAAAKLPKSGLAVTIDIGDPENIHPKNKHDVGHRLALIALANEYGQKLEYSGPVFSAVKFEDSKAVVSFTHADGLAARGGGALTGFLIAGEDGIFWPADAEIDKKSVRLSSPKVPKPMAVRYAWAASPECNLVNSTKLPAGPFRYPMK
jgi:sialate O-acetylesterase